MSTAYVLQQGMCRPAAAGHVSWKPSACRRGTRSGVLLQKLMVNEPFLAQPWFMVHDDVKLHGLGLYFIAAYS